MLNLVRLNPFKRIYMYFKGRQIWKAKMSEDLKIQIVSNPGKSRYSDERVDKMSKLNSIVDMVCKLRNNDISSDVISEAAYILEQPVEELVLREYLNGKVAKDEFMQYDAFRDTYKKKDANDYEELRRRTLKAIETEEDIFKQIELLLERSKEIKEGIKGIYYNDRFRECCKVPFMVETCKNMILAGASLTEITKYVPESIMGDIYHLATDHLGLHLEITEDEKAEIERYDKQMENGEQTEGHTNVWRQIFTKGIPKQKDGVWTLNDDDKLYNTFEMACHYAGCDLSYPYFQDDVKSPKYADSFEEVLENVMLSPKDTTIEGLERAYSQQEYHLVVTLRKKLLEAIAKEESESM